MGSAWLLEPEEDAIINDNKVKGINPVLLLLSFLGATTQQVGS